MTHISLSTNRHFSFLPSITLRPALGEDFCTAKVDVQIFNIITIHVVIEREASGSPSKAIKADYCLVTILARTRCLDVDV